MTTSGIFIIVGGLFSIAYIVFMCNVEPVRKSKYRFIGNWKEGGHILLLLAIILSLAITVGIVKFMAYKEVAGL